MRASELASDLTQLRASLAEELLSVNRYVPLTESLTHDEARAVVKRIVDARKEHVAALTDVIERLDPRQAEANRALRS